MFLRLSQYLKRFSSVYLTTLPGGYQKKKVKILTEFYYLLTEYFEKIEARYWLSYGTLLGYHRAEEILAHDIDIDFGATKNDYELMVHNQQLLPKGVKLFNTSKNHNGPKIYFNYKGFDADVYFYEEKDQHLMPFLISDIPADMKPVPKDSIFPLKSVEFLGRKTFIPQKTEEHLIHCYGYIGPDAYFGKDKYWHKIQSD